MKGSLLFKKGLVLLSGMFFITLIGCSESKSPTKSSGYYDYYGNYYSNSSSTSGNACDGFSTISNAYEGSVRHLYVGEFRLTSGSSAQKIYQQMLNDLGSFCKVNSSGSWQIDPYTGQYVYTVGSYSGVSNCDYWDDFFKLWISFPRSNTSRADLTLDSTMSGYPSGWSGQGYDVQRTSMSQAQIDCTDEDDLVIYYEPAYGVQLKVKIYSGNKNSDHLRAEIFYKGSSIGKSDFFIVTN